MDPLSTDFIVLPATEGTFRFPLRFSVQDGMAAHFADRWSVVATLFAVPVFAFFAAGVTVGGWDGLVSAFSDPITIGIVVGLVAGKPIGILVTTCLLSRFPALRLDETLRWPDLTGMAFLAGIGFTVSLLVGDLAARVRVDDPVDLRVGQLAAVPLGADHGDGVHGHG